MCHLVLLMPLFGLGLFWVLPWPVATSAHLAIDLVSALLYFKVMQAMKLPISIGREALTGNVVEVVAALETPSLARYLVQQGGELWSAVAEAQFSPGDRAVIIGFQGALPRIEHVQDGTQSLPETQTKTCH